MPSRFQVLPADDALAYELLRLDPTNAFSSPAYFKAMKKLGLDAWILAIEDNGAIIGGCGAFQRSGRLNKRLNIPSLSPISTHEKFWPGVTGFCTNQGIAELSIETFHSPAFPIPRFSMETIRAARHEYVLILDNGGDLSARFSSNHKRNIRKAYKAGLSIRRNRSSDFVPSHLDLISTSLERRRERGESVSGSSQEKTISSLIEAGAGEIFQAVLGASVLSSIFLLRAPRGAYYQSAGSSPDGMTLGASHYLVATVAEILQSEGLQVFNLGGAAEGSSLARFKEGFGTSSVPQVAVTAHVGGRVRRKLTTLLKLLAQDRSRLKKFVSGSFERWLVYEHDTTQPSVFHELEGAQIRFMDDLELTSAVSTDPGFHARQTERLSRFGQSYAYGVFVDGRLAHISWLLPTAALADQPHPIVSMIAGDFEISACETLPEYRGRGLYPFAISRLTALARDAGATRVFMKTKAENRPSRKGIAKAGFRLYGSVVIVAPPFFPSKKFFWRRSAL